METIHETIGHKQVTYFALICKTFTDIHCFYWSKFTIWTSDNSEIDRTYIVTPTVTAWPKKCLRLRFCEAVFWPMNSKILC